ncbi:golgin subfamily B member 1 [Hyperolius riggenbachi]|uniref:golgin subfamily B member 1 n=1 Tax=Hyperolius riggenbachi TaxID=752182 RepID=UPI0035A271F9
MLSRLSGLANTVLHELSGEGDGAENGSAPVSEPATAETMSEDQMETLAHYEQLVIQLKELIQQKDAEIHQKCTELQQKETQIKVEKEASDAKFSKLKLQAKAKVTTLTKQIEELKKAAVNQVNPDGSNNTLSTGEKDTVPGAQINGENASKLQDTINELTRQLHDSQSQITKLTEQLSESQQTIGALTKQLQDSEENVTDLTRALQESGDAARELHKKQEAEIHHLQIKLEEQSEALNSRTQVVQMLEQELQSAELQKQVLTEQFRSMEQDLQSVRDSLSNEQRENAHFKELLQVKDDAYQRLQEELEKEKITSSEIESLRTEVEKGKLSQDELENIKKELELEKEARKQVEETRRQLDIQVQENKILNAQIEKDTHDELERLRADLEKERAAQKELVQLRLELEQQNGAQEEMENLKLEQTKCKDLQEEVKHLSAELAEGKEAHEQLKEEIETLKRIIEELLEERTGQQEAVSSRNDPDDLSMQSDHLNQELNEAKESHEKLLMLREELQRVKESLGEFDQVKDELERGQETLLKLEIMKQELEKINEAEKKVVVLQVEIDRKKTADMKDHLEQVSGPHTETLDREELLQDEPLTNKDISEINQQNKAHAVELQQTLDTNTKPQVKQQDTSDVLTPLSTGDPLESVNHQQEQMMSAYVIDVQTHSVSQELVMDVVIEDTKQKQLSILMLDLMDTQEEINKLKGQLTMEQQEETSSMIKHTMFSTEIAGNLEEVGDSNISYLEELVKDLKLQLESVTTEKEALSFKLQTLLEEQGSGENLSQSEKHSSGLEKQYLPDDYESQNILAEQMSSLETELKSKDIKITALQKDLDNMSLLLSEHSALSKLQESQLEENKRNNENLRELLTLSQNKEERLSEALATNEREISSLEERLSQKASDVNGLQHSLAEKEQQIAEISHSLSDKVVLLNEEKFSMLKEIKALKEQLNSVFQEQSGREDESLELLRKANADLNLQIKEIIKEKSELLTSIQTELNEVKSQLETVSFDYTQSQKVIKSVEGERDELYNLLQDQKREFVDLQNQVENQRHSHEQQLQLLTEKYQGTLDAINCLQAEKIELELQRNSYADKLRYEGDVGWEENKKDVNSEVEQQKKETEKLKKKLQAALVSRKELSKKVSELEEKMVKNTADKHADTDNALAMQTSKPKCDKEMTSEQHITEEWLKSQLSEKESELEIVRAEVVKISANNEQLQILIAELREELNDKYRNTESSQTEQRNRMNSESVDVVSLPSQLNTEEEVNTIVQLESRVMILEQDKENLQKKVQEAVNSRKDTIKKAQEKDRHHREQLKQHKEEFNLLREKYENLQKCHGSDQSLDRVSEEKAMQTEILYSTTKLHDDISVRSQSLISMHESQNNSEKSYWGEDWVDFSTGTAENTIVNQSPSLDLSLNIPQEQLDLLQTQKNELELKALQLEEKLDENMQEVSHLRDTVDHLSTQLQQEREKCQDLEAQTSVLKTDIENNKGEISCMQEFNLHSVENELICKTEEAEKLHQEIEGKNTALENSHLLISEKDEIILSLKSKLQDQTKEYEEHCTMLELHLKELQQKLEDCVELEKIHQELEEKNISLKNANMLVSEKENLILSLKSQLEFQAKEHEERCKTLELHVEEVQQKQNEDIEEEKGKQQLQRKLQAALISRKDALKESKALKVELEKIRIQKEALANKLQVAEGSVSELSLERDTLLKTISTHKEEREKLIKEIDKCLLENQNLEASCESLKLAMVGITQNKEDLSKNLESLTISKDLKISEWQDKLSDLQKEYETLLQSYENVSNETDRMKRCVETVKQEKQELYMKMKSKEVEKSDLGKQLEEAEFEIENMKEKMRKFAKSKQQKILELEEENDRLRGEMQQTAEKQKPVHLKEDLTILKEELEKAQSENGFLKSDLEAVKYEKENLVQENETLKLQLNDVTLDLQKVIEGHSTVKPQEDVIAKDETVELNSPSPSQKEEHIEENHASLELLANKEDFKLRGNLEKISELEEFIKNLEESTKEKDEELEKMKQTINSFEEDTQTLKRQLLGSQDRVSTMERDIADLEDKYQRAMNDLAEAKKLRQVLEIEKDELEERLMNQMAELNGSIGNFQQDAMDLQIKNESLQRELEELHLRLEEERRQLERQKAEALSEVHKEYVEKLKSVYQGEKGKKTLSKELQELLKEKQQEVRHLQKDCIQYQETISALERSIKSLEFVHAECEKETVASNTKIEKAVADTKQAQADLASLRVLLDDTQSEAARVLAENLKLKDELKLATEKTTLMLKEKDEDLKNKLEQESEKHLKQMVNLEEKINILQQDKEQLEASISNLQGNMEVKNQELKDLQANLNQNIANLAAFTRSMCSLQDDRDRVIEESKKWNGKFNDELQKKDSEILDKERILMDLKNELMQVSTQVDELKTHINRLELENQNLIAIGKAEAENLSKSRDSLAEEKAILSSCLEEKQKALSVCQEQINMHAQEAKDGMSQLEVLNRELLEVKSEKHDLLEMVKRFEADVQDLKLHSEQILSDLQASKSLTEQLHKELEEKEQDIMQLLSARDEAVSAAVGELNELHAGQCKALEQRLGEAEEERKRVQSKVKELRTLLKTNQEEADRSKAQLQAFTKSMCSLQEERERLLSDYQQLEQRHLDAILAKDSLIQEAAAESNELREELRYLKSHTDDLNAQNAKLNAQLTRYRGDLNEVISLKDSQLKQLLGEKLQEIEKLRIEQNNQETLLNREKGEKDALQQELDETKKEKQSIQEEANNLANSISQLQSENETLRANLKEETEEVQRLKDELPKLQTELENVKEEASRIQVEAQQRVQFAEENLNKQLQSIQHDTGILRNETETAEERVAELARDLMETEQKLLNAHEQISSLNGQIQAFGGSMRSLQDSHDLAQEEIITLQEQLKEMAVLNEELTLVKTERNNLSVMLSESKEEQQRIQIQLNNLMTSLQLREDEKSRMTSDHHALQMQLQNMSKAMGSLQEDRDRLQSRMNTPQREVERTLQSSYQRDHQVSKDDCNMSLEEIQSTQTELQNLRTQLNDSLTQVHQKELRIQQLNVKLSQIFEEKNALSLQLRSSNINLREAINRCSSLERQLQEMSPKSSEPLPSDSAPGAPQEKKEPQTDADQQLMELQQRYLELKQQNTEQEHVRSFLEQQLRDERRRAEDRIQELDENVNRLRSQDWSVQEEPVVPHELSLLMEPPEIPGAAKARSSSPRRLLRLIFCSRTKTPLLASLYLLLIHALLFLCLTGQL